MSSTTQFLKAYEQHVQLRASEGIAPLPLSAEQVAELVELLKNPPQDAQGSFLVELLSQRIAPGVDPAAYVKAAFLAALAKGEAKSPFIDPAHNDLCQFRSPIRETAYYL